MPLISVYTWSSAFTFAHCGLVSLKKCWQWLGHIWTPSSYDNDLSLTVSVWNRSCLLSPSSLTLQTAEVVTIRIIWSISVFLGGSYIWKRSSLQFVTSAVLLTSLSDEDSSWCDTKFLFFAKSSTSTSPPSPHHTLEFLMCDTETAQTGCGSLWKNFVLWLYVLQ